MKLKLSILKKKKTNSLSHNLFYYYLYSSFKYNLNLAKMHLNFNINLFVYFLFTYFKKIKKKFNKNNFYMLSLNFYLYYFLEKKLNKSIIILYKNYRYVLKKILFYKFVKKKLFFSNKIKSLRYFKSKDYSLIFSSLLFQDIYLLRNWLQIKMIKMSFKKHRRFLYFLKVFLISSFLPYIKKFNLKGFYIKVKGKIGLGGNSKKRTYVIKCGKFARYNKSLKLYYDFFSVSTLSGVLGIKIILLYI
ncbi:MAG: hypothetical protein IPK87_17450 [Planctomycetes bacterium]|nr:hypothetical protein [Planctomycetota bacterium]